MLIPDGLNAFSSTRILCVGDGMLDVFMRGKANRLSPEAPVPVLHIEEETRTLGGAANVVRNLESLGATVTFISVIGEDVEGSHFQNLLTKHLKVTAHLLVDTRRVTTVKTRFLSEKQHFLRADREQCLPLTEALEAELLRLFRSALPVHDLVLLSDYAKGLFSPKGLQALIGEAHLQKKPILVDPKGLDYSRYAGATLLTPNRSELASATQMPVQTDEDLVAAAQKIMSLHGIPTMIVTRDAEGMTLIEGTGRSSHFSVEPQEILSVSGAGDTAIATIAIGLAAGLPLADTMRLANVAAGVVVGKPGTSVIHFEELVTALSRDERQGYEKKIVSWPQAAEIVQKWQQSRQRVVFTNGCFDLLHPGHISLLAQAKKKGDRLVVGLNTDESIRRLKGPTRPVQQEHARALVLSSLESVDLVIFFDCETPLELIKVLRPDALVKGADYTISQLAGAPVVQSYGGQVHLIELVEGHSTTHLISKMGLPSLASKE